jgi:hypothetical protein
VGEDPGPRNPCAQEIAGRPDTWTRGDEHWISPRDTIFDGDESAAKEASCKVESGTETENRSGDGGRGKRGPSTRNCSGIAAFRHDVRALQKRFGHAHHSEGPRANMEARSWTIAYNVHWKLPLRRPLRDSKPAPYPEAREQHSEAIKLVKQALAAPTMPGPVETASPAPC